MTITYNSHNSYTTSLVPHIENNDPSTFHLNLQSINTDSDKVVAYLERLKMKLDVICLTESKMTEGKCYDHIFARFILYDSCRKNTKKEEALQSVL